MPSYTQEIAVPGVSAEHLGNTSFVVIEKLDWKITALNEYEIVALTSQSWNKNSNEVRITAAENLLTVTSKMIHGEMMDFSGRTKKDVKAFIEMFESTTQDLVNEESVKLRIDVLKNQLSEAAAKDSAEAEKLLKVMKWSRGGLRFTYLLLIVNVVVFVLMAVDGAGIIEPNGSIHVKWGSNFSFLTMKGEKWRLFTSLFIHFGILHLVMNMYALYMAGFYLESMLGRTRFLTAYFACGIIGGLTSLWWHTEGVNSAGASGAIFGLYGLFLSLMFTKVIPEVVRKSLLQTTLVFVGFNLLYGMKGGIDNAAHIGGLVAGLLLGLLYARDLKNEERGRQVNFTGPLALVAAVIIAVLFIGPQQPVFLPENETPDQYNQQRTNFVTRKDIVQDIDTVTAYGDNEKFLAKFRLFLNMQQMALEPNFSIVIYSTQEESTNPSLGEWERAEMAVSIMKGFDLSEPYKQKVILLGEYVELRKQEAVLRVQLADKATKKRKENLRLLEEKIQGVATKINELK